ncbi:MAG: Ig-like domain-containing protein [Gemmatimonadetes bacterium]|nr:Ig-like domain-containing protein [Gemmatimonadota bacterium]
MHPRSLLAGVLAALFPAVAATQNVAEVQVAPPTLTLKVGERSGLLATAFDRIGNVIPTVRLIWSSNSVNVARVDNNGTVTGVAVGVAIIEAREARSGRRGQAAVQVIAGPGGVAAPSAPVTAAPPTQAPPGTATAVDPYAGQPAGTGPAVALRIEPPSIYLLPSENTKVSPRALREDGSSAAPMLVTWKSLREDIASVDQNGNVVALAPGQGTLQVTGPGGLTATAPVVVQQADIAIYEQGPLMLSPGDVDTLHVTVPAQNNRLVSPLALQWTSSDPNVVRVSLTGVITAAGSGKAQLAVTGLLQSRAIDVQVHRPVEILVARPRSQAEIPLPLSGTQRFEVQALAADNTPVPEAPLRWSLSDTTVASFDAATGVLTGKAIGRTQLIVRGPGQGLSVVWTINVIAGTVKLSASRLGLAPGEKYAGIKATFTDDNGAVIAPATGLAWSTSDGTVATVGEDGTITAVGYGKARITATAPGGKTATVDVFVQGEILVAKTRNGKFELYALERSNLAALRKVSADTGGGTEPAFSPDGSRIAFVSLRDRNPEIYLMDADGSNPTRLTNDPQADGRPVFTADGQSLLFHSTRWGKHQQIFAMGLDGQGVRQLTQDSANTQPTVSPDGGTIAFVTTRDGKQPHIWLMARDGSSQRAFTRASPNKDLQNRETYPQFLRDGSLAYLSERKEGNRTVTQVVRAELATGTVTPLTGTDLFIWSFAIAPAGDLLALVVPLPGQERRRNPAFKVYVQTVGSGTPVPIPATGTEQMATPAFQP